MPIRQIFTQKSDFFRYTSDFDRENIRLNKTAEASLPDTKKSESWSLFQWSMRQNDTLNIRNLSMIKLIQYVWSCLPDTGEAVLLGRNAMRHRHPILSKVLVSGKEIDGTSNTALLSRREGCDHPSKRSQLPRLFRTITIIA